MAALAFITNSCYYGKIPKVKEILITHLYITEPENRLFFSLVQAICM